MLQVTTCVSIVVPHMEVCRRPEWMAATPLTACEPTMARWAMLILFSGSSSTRDILRMRSRSSGQCRCTCYRCGNHSERVERQSLPLSLSLSLNSCNLCQLNKANRTAWLSVWLRATALCSSMFIQVALAHQSLYGQVEMVLRPQGLRTVPCEVCVCYNVKYQGTCQI